MSLNKQISDKEKSSRRISGYYSYKYGDSFEDSKGRGKLVSARVPSDPEDLDSDERKESFQDGFYPYRRKVALDAYYDHKFPLQIELVKMQNWVRATGQKIVILYEGRDAAGKGGTIRRFMEHLNPRGAKVIALEKPTEEERGQWYFQRYVQHLPTRGEIVLFDRSWYNRAGVEKVMSFCSDEEYEEFLLETPLVEQMWVNNGIWIIKLYFSVSRKEQSRRFKRRSKDPLKQWKLSPVDMASRDKWDDYTQAKETMFYRTHTEHAPWYIVKSDDKMRARIVTMRHVLDLLPYEDKDDSVVYPADPWLVARADEIWDIEAGMTLGPAPSQKEHSNGSRSDSELVVAGAGV